ncbi:hypothetical protein D3C72_1613680 [compost metagenome]
MVILENHTDLATQKRHLTVFQTADIVAAKKDVPGAWPLDPTDKLEQGTFPRAGVAGQECHLARLQVECHPLQRLSPTEIGLADVFKANHC